MIILFWLCICMCLVRLVEFLDSKVHEANMGPTWGRKDPGGPHVGPWTLLSGVVCGSMPRLCLNQCWSIINQMTWIFYRYSLDIKMFFQPLMIADISYTSIRIRVGLSKFIHLKRWHVITQPCSNFSGSSVKPLLKPSVSPNRVN